MRRILNKLYLEENFFYGIIGIVILFILSYFFDAMFIATTYLFFGFLAIFFLDIYILFSKNNGLKGKRILPEKLSNGDLNPIEIHLKNTYSFKINTKTIDEIPIQFQKRDFLIKRELKPLSELIYKYELRPTERGEYWFGKLIIYVQSSLKLVSKRYDFESNEMVATYPSFIQLKKFDLFALAYRNQFGLKKIRRIGHTLEFEQINEYVSGDDIRTINWKATAKKNQLMVNKYQDEKAQPIYSLIDKGRVMKMPFNDLSLLDYAINATLVLSNITLRKNDKAGMMCFSNKVENRVEAGKKNNQLNRILESLYNVETNFKETDFGVLYGEIRRKIKSRSLLFLYTNFETLDGMERQLSYLQAIARSHVLVVVFFENTELETIIKQKAISVEEIYQKTIAEKFIFEKRLIVKNLQRRGIFSILTKPENLTIKVINKYLEIKSRGMV